jgi:hypothetical protein
MEPRAAGTSTGKEEGMARGLLLDAKDGPRVGAATGNEERAKLSAVTLFHRG